jgi:hypothetical protein
MKFKSTQILFLLAILSFQTNAQSNFDKLKAELKSNLKWFSDDYIYSDYEENNIDIDSLATITERKLTQLLTLSESYNLDPKEFPNLNLFVTSNDSLNIRFFSFSNSVGPTGYESVHTVIQWTNRTGKLLSYCISSKIPGSISKIHKLKSESSVLYLILANDYFTTIQYVIQFKGDYLILDYPAFVNSPQLLFNRMNSFFSDKTQELTIESYEDVGIDDNTLLPMSVRADENPSFRKLTSYFERQFKNKKLSKLKFDGIKFIY